MLFRSAAAVVTGGGPHGVMIGGVELTGHQAGSQAAEGSAHLVAAGGEPLAGHGNDAAGHAGRSYSFVRMEVETAAISDDRS